MGHRRRAFTLFEIVLVMGVIVVIGALAFPLAQSMWADNRVAAAGDLLRSRWVEARNLAKEQGRPYRFSYQEDTGRYRIAPDAEEFWGDGAPSQPSSADPEGKQPLTTIEGDLPEGILFSAADADKVASAGTGGQWGQPATFQADGSLREDYRLGFGRPGQRPVVLRLRAMTGSVTAEEPK